MVPARCSITVGRLGQDDAEGWSRWAWHCRAPGFQGEVWDMNRGAGVQVSELLSKAYAIHGIGKGKRRRKTKGGGRVV